MLEQPDPDSIHGDSIAEKAASGCLLPEDGIESAQGIFGFQDVAHADILEGEMQRPAAVEHARFQVGFPSQHRGTDGRQDLPGPSSAPKRDAVEVHALVGGVVRDRNPADFFQARLRKRFAGRVVVMRLRGYVHGFFRQEEEEAQIPMAFIRPGIHIEGRGLGERRARDHGMTVGIPEKEKPRGQASQDPKSSGEMMYGHTRPEKVQFPGPAKDGEKPENL